MNKYLASILFLVITLSFIWPPTVSHAGGNPLISGKPAPQTKNTITELIDSRTGFLAPVFDYQARLYQELSEKLESYSETNSAKTLWLLILAGLLYGILHAIGPGHGKVLSASYFGTHNEPLRRAIQFSFLAALLHTLSALSLVIILKIILSAFSLVTFETISFYVRTVSFSLICIIGIILLISHLRKSKDNDETGKSRLSFWGLVLSVGMVPCPGALVILIFCYSMDILGTGIIITIAMSIGMAITMALVSTTVLLGNKGILSQMTKGERFTWLGHAVEIFGSLLIIAMGLFLLAGELLSHEQLF